MVQKLMLEIGSKIQPTVSNSTKSESRKDNFDGFKSILSSAENRTTRDDKAPKMNSVKADHDDTNDREKYQYRTYNEAVRRSSSDNSQKCKEKISAKENVEGSKQQEETEKVSRPRGNAAVEALAGVLGMNPSDVNKLLQDLNINPEDLADSQKTSEVADKISKVLDMTGSQKQVLSEILNAISKELQEHTTLSEVASNKENVIPEQSKHSMEKAEGNNNEPAKVEVIKTAKPEVSEIALKFKNCINEAASKLNSDPKKFINEISAKVKQIADTASNNENSGKKVMDETKLSEKQAKMEEINEADQKVKQNSAASDQETDSENMHSDSNKPGLAATLEKVNVKQEDNTAAVPFNNTVNAELQKNSEVQAVKLPKETVASKSEIISQVVEKAKVAINGDKSEMVMDLKPDSLGKLSLKVVTERGIVTAQFVAESDQVKQVLEANMQLLKDVLERQGMAVQGFSVSVGQNNDQRPGKWESNRAKSGKIADSKSVNTAIGVAAAGHEKSNLYSIGENRINLTA